MREKIERKKKYKGRATSRKLCPSVHFYGIYKYGIISGFTGKGWILVLRLPVAGIGEITGGKLEQLEGLILISGGQVKGKSGQPVYGYS